MILIHRHTFKIEYPPPDSLREEEEEESVSGSTAIASHEPFHEFGRSSLGRMFLHSLPLAASPPRCQLGAVRPTRSYYGRTLRGAQLQNKQKKIKTFMPRHRHLVSPSPTRLPPSLHHPHQRLTIDQFLHRLRVQHQHVAWLIGVFSPSHRIQYYLSFRPGVIVVSTLWDCLSLQDTFAGEFISLNTQS